jgi:hypothetical protein
MLELHPNTAEKKGKKKKEKGIETDPFGNMESFWGMEKNPISIRPVE